MNQFLKVLTITSFALVFILAGLFPFIDDPNDIGPYILLPFGAFFIFATLLSELEFGEAIVLKERITKTTNPVKYYLCLSIPLIMGLGLLSTGIYLVIKKN